MEPDKVIPAIHGRCQQMELERVGPDDITERLQAICKILKEKRIDKENLASIAHQTGGQVRDAVQALEAVIQYLDGTDQADADLGEIIANFLRSSMAADDQVAIKSLVWLYAQFQEGDKKRIATLKKMLGTLMDVSNAVSVSNTLLSLNSYLISNACNNKHKNVWHTANNTTLTNLLNKNVPWRTNFGSSPLLPAALTVQSHLLELRRDLVTLNTSEISQIQAHLGRAFMAVTEFLPE
jgi:DNA polymerase III gamma/tau subunit